MFSKFVPDGDTANVANVVAALSTTPVNTVSTTITWRVVEPVEGHLDLAPYYPFLDGLVAKGYRLLIILDSSGRGLLDAQRTVTTTPAVPGWVVQRAPEAFATDFFGGASAQLDYFDPVHFERLQAFYAYALDALKARYPNDIVAVAPGIMSELEIKYSQDGFKWRSFTPNAQANFDLFLTQHGRPAAPMPVPAYGNPLAGGSPHHEPLLPALMEFRELAVTNYACALTALIRSRGFWAFGYFAQPLAYHDGIYATGAIERCVECFDAISIDYNFYNGYATERRPDVVPALMSYALGLGYRHLVAGLYVERFRDPKTDRFDETILPVLKQSLVGLPPDERIIGLDVGGLTPAEFPLLEKYGLVLPAKRAPVPERRTAPIRIGVLASMTNSLLWHGEWSNDRQMLQDALLRAYTVLRAVPDFEVSMIAEEPIRRNPAMLEGFDVVYLPHVTAVDERVRTALANYVAGGGRLAQDERFDSFTPDGTFRPSSFDATFGIGGQQWEHRDATFCLGGQLVKFPRQQRKYASFSRYAPTKGFTLGLEDLDHPGTGLVLRGPRTLALGYLGQLMEDTPRAPAWTALFVAELRALAADATGVPPDVVAALGEGPCPTRP